LAAEEARKEQQRQAQEGIGSISRKTTALGPGAKEKGPSSMFIFSEDNIIRRNA
jgi:hypothetical protein